jgi:DHA2 family methylenomycin A resistance protein-like MFS transporter
MYPSKTVVLPAQTRASSASVIVASSFGFALVQLDVTIINVALPSIAQTLHTDVTGLQWLVDAYALTFSMLLLSFGALSDRIGAKRVYIAGMLGFAITSLACGVAASAPALIAMRVLQGVAAAAMLPSSLALLNHATAHDPRLRARAVGIWTAAGGVTIAAGPLLAGLLLAVSSWPSIFLVNLPLCALGVWLTSQLPSSRASDARSVDVIGQLLAIVAVGSVTAAVIEARPLGFSHPWILGGFALGALAGAAFVLVEMKSCAPMLPLALFRSRIFRSAVCYGMIANATYYGIVFVISLYLQRVHGYSPLRTGLAYLPLTLTIFAINLVSGWAVGRFGSRWPMVIGALINASGFLLLSRLTAHSSYWHMLPAFTLIPLGLGTGVPAMTTAVLANVDKARAGVATGVLNAARQAAGAMGVAVFGALAGDPSAQIVTGLSHAAIISCTLLLTAAAVAWQGMRSPR